MSQGITFIHLCCSKRAFCVVSGIVEAEEDLDQQSSLAALETCNASQIWQLQTGLPKPTAQPLAAGLPVHIPGFAGGSAAVARVEQPTSPDAPAA